MCVCVCVNHFAVLLKLTQRCKSTILQFFKKLKKQDVSEGKWDPSYGKNKWIREMKVPGPACKETTKRVAWPYTTGSREGGESLEHRPLTFLFFILAVGSSTSLQSFWTCCSYKPGTELSPGLSLNSACWGGRQLYCYSQMEYYGSLVLFHLSLLAPDITFYNRSHRSTNSKYLKAVEVKIECNSKAKQSSKQIS